MLVPHEARISAALLRQLIDGCQSALPEEACGVLIGERHADYIAIRELAFVPNASAEPDRTFAFEPGAWIAAAYAARTSRRCIVGLFHSHPAHPPIPSRSDLQGWDGCGTYWIVGLAASPADIRAYRLDADGELMAMRIAVH